MISIGTAGYSYADWVGPFYPPGTKRADMLSVYATHFPVTELDFTYYQMPGVRTMQGLAAKSPDHFQFAVKANRQMTHSPELGIEEIKTITSQFLGSLAPLQDTGKLACLLLQFPYSFRNNPANVERIAWFRDIIADIPLVIEFRQISWVNQTTFEFLRQYELNFCCVDEPQLPGLFPPLAVSTGSLAYLRFHGRNKEKWWNHNETGERYDYLYSDQELNEWLPKVKTLENHSGMVLVLFNNCHFGQAARNAQKMQELLFPDL